MTQPALDPVAMEAVHLLAEMGATTINLRRVVAWSAHIQHMLSPRQPSNPKDLMQRMGISKTHFYRLVNSGQIKKTSKGMYYQVIE